MPTNDPQRWALLRRHFEKLVELDTESQGRMLESLRADDAPLAHELESLLAEDRHGAGDDAAPVTSRVVGAVHRLAADLGLEAERARPAWIGDYRIVDTLGSGGMGVVYLAEQQSPRRTVALKVVRGIGAERSIRRFRREAELHGRLQHPNIAQVFEAGMARERGTDGEEHGAPRPFFAMEFVRGEPLLADAARRRLPIAERIDLVARVADAIDHAHARGVIHRDLKSANILVDEQGQPKVLDFGIARALDRDHAATMETAAGEVIGTLPYMSPEQVSGRGEQIGARSDVYALGVVLFEMLTGRRPLELSGRPIPEAVRIVVDEEPTRLGSIDRSLRGDLETIVARCLEKDPTRRYPSAGALAEDLRRFLTHRPIEARPASTLYQVGRFARRHRPLVISVTIAFMALVAATVLSIVMAVRATAAQHSAEKAGAELKEQLRVAGVENARATQAFKFLSDLLTAADPDRKLSPQTTVVELVRHAAEALQKGAGGDNQVTGLLGHIIGVTLWRLGDIPLAEQALRRSVELLRVPDDNAIGPEYTLLLVMTNLSQMLRLNGRPDDAEAVLREIVEIRTVNIRRNGRDADTLGVTPEADFYRSVAMNDLALIMADRGDYAGAEAMAMRAHDMERKLVDMGHGRQRALAITLWNVGENRRRQFKHAEAEPALAEAHALAISADGAESSVALRIGLALGANLTTLGRFGEAQAVLESVVAIRRASGNDMDAALAESYLAAAHSQRGEVLAALALTNSACERYRRAKAPAVDRIRAQTARAALLAASGDHEAASREFTDAERLLEQTPGAPAELREELRIQESIAARLAHRSDEAFTHAESALSLIERRRPGEARAAATARRELALALASTGDPGRVRDGVARLEACADFVRGNVGAAHPMVGRLELAIAEALRALGDSTSAAEHAEHAARALSHEGGTAPWMARYAELLLESLRHPESVTTASFQDRVRIVREAIEAVAGPRSPDLARVSKLGAAG